MLKRPAAPAPAFDEGGITAEVLARELGIEQSVAQPALAASTLEQLEAVLAEAAPWERDALLGLDDANIYNPTTIKSILLSSYARKQALIGPTAAFIKAGSLSSTYSDKDDWLHSLQVLLQMPSDTWPHSFYPEEFKVRVNQQVARSLRIQNMRPQKLKKQLKQARPTP